MHVRDFRGFVVRVFFFVFFSFVCVCVCGLFVVVVVVVSLFVSLFHLGWCTADAEIKVPSLQNPFMAFSFNLNQDRSEPVQPSSASTTDRNCDAFPIHSTSFPPQSSSSNIKSWMVTLTCLEL